MVDAQNAVGYLLTVGESLPHDLRSSRRGIVGPLYKAIRQRRSVYATGRGVRLAYVEAYMWFSLAFAKRATEQICKDCAMCSLMTPKQMQEAEGRAVSWRTETRVQAIQEGSASSIMARPRCSLHSVTYLSTYASACRQGFIESHYGHGLAVGLGSRIVHANPNAIVRPCGRAIARYSGSYLNVKLNPLGGRIKLLCTPIA